VDWSKTLDADNNRQLFVQMNKIIYKINDYIHYKYVIVQHQLRTLIFHEVSKIFAFCIEKNLMDVNVKKILVVLLIIAAKA